MRLFVIGESRFGAAFIRAAADAGHEIVGVAAQAWAPDWRPDAPSAAAFAAGVPVWPAAPIVDGWARPLKESGAELLVLADVSSIVPASVLTACPRGALCFHPSLLPRHRGRRSVPAAFKAGDTYTGVTVFWPDDGADTGPIAAQMRIEILPDDNPSRLYHDTLVPAGVHLMLAVLAAAAGRRAARLPQEPPP